MEWKLTQIVPGMALAPPLADADELFAALTNEIEVAAELVDEGGSIIATPRLTGWYGDAEATYTYSGIARLPNDWTPTLAALRDRFNAELSIALNSCLVGVYEDGSNTVDWHADDEPELRDRIVSVSLGAERTFLLRAGTMKAPLAVPLAHGSVLIMDVASQQQWQHAVPAQPGAGRRINLTYRTIAHV